nr:hypothetical protein [Tanacetum cinerariifolium]
MFCYFDAFLTSIELKNYKEALKESYWIKGMQEELNKFERLEVWVLIARLDRVMIITLKWIFKVKLDDLGGILKYKARTRGHKIFIAYAPHKNMTVYQIDVKTTFLNCILREEAPQAWYDLLSSFLHCHKFSKGVVDPTLFTQKEGKDNLL